MKKIVVQRGRLTLVYIVVGCGKTETLQHEGTYLDGVLKRGKGEVGSGKDQVIFSHEKMTVSVG